MRRAGQIARQRAESSVIRPTRTSWRYQSTSTPSEASTSSWTPALPAGQSPAYDAAIAYLDSHQSRLLTRISTLRESPSSSESLASIARLEVEAYVNDPATRRLFRDTLGKGHMAKAVFRHLAENRWKKEGGLDLLMQRVFQLGVVPDLLGEIGGSCPLILSPSNGAEVEPGSIQQPSTFATPPSLRCQLFDHPILPTADDLNPTGLFTLLVIDPDSPSYETLSYTQRLHYAKSDIPLSVLSGEVDLFASPGSEVVSWEPPAPPQGSGKHRYTFLLLRQPSALSFNSPLERENFDLRTFFTEHSLTPNDVVGITLLRSQWTKEEAAYIEETYEKHRGAPAPVYGKPPKEMRYGYPLSAKAARAEVVRRQAWDEAVMDLEGVVQEMQGLAKDRQPENGKVMTG